MEPTMLAKSKFSSTLVGQTISFGSPTCFTGSPNENDYFELFSGVAKGVQKAVALTGAGFSVATLFVGVSR